VPYAHSRDAEPYSFEEVMSVDLLLGARTHQKLFATNPEKQVISILEMGPENIADLAKHLIARRVAVQVIVLLKVVYVHDGDGTNKTIGFRLNVWTEIPGERESIGKPS
jgi:hypothetical protein